MVEDWTFSHKIGYFTTFYKILNLKGHANCISGSKVTAILLNRWILPIGGASAVKGLRCSLRSRLVSKLLVYFRGILLILGLC